MNHDQNILERESGIPAHPERAASAVGVLTGAVMGAATGFFAAAGTIGMAVGGVVGALAGFGVTKVTRERSKRDSAKDAQLDRDIGIIGGDIGAAPPGSSPPSRGGGTYSAASSGAAGLGGTTPASGPIPR